MANRILFDSDDEKNPPVPLRDYVLVRRLRPSLAGLIIPEGVESADRFVAEAVGPKCEGISIGDGLELSPQLANSRVIRVTPELALVPEGCIVGVYPRAEHQA